MEVTWMLAVTVGTMTLNRTVIEPLSRRLSRYARIRLCRLSLYLKPQQLNPDYPQTWWLRSQIVSLVLPPAREARTRYWEIRSWIFCRVLNPIHYWLCGLIIGHELSETEKGYRGGITEDRHCRWCDKVFQVPAGEFAKEWGGDIKGSLCGF